MKNELATTTNVPAIQDAELISFLDALGLTSKLNENEKKTYLGIAKAFNLNPFKREIHVSKYGEQMSIITGYEVYIKRAERSTLLNGWDVKISGSVDANNPTTGDLMATITIHRKDRDVPFVWDVYYDECVQTTRDGKVTAFWKKPKFMLKKVAISQGFRLCFSDELGGMPYTSDEMPDVQTVDTPHEVIQPTIKLTTVILGSKVFTSAVKAIRGGKTFEEVESTANGAGWTFDTDEIKNALNEAVEVAA